VIGVKKVIFFFIIILTIFFTTVPILEGVYLTVFQSEDHFTFHNQLLFLTKYFLAIAVLFLILFFNIQLTQQGKKLIPFIIVVSFLGFLFASVNFVVTDDEKIVEQRLWGRDVKTWDEVSHITTDAVLVNVVKRSRRKSVPKFEYRIFFDDGSSVDAWEGVNANYELHTYIVQKEIKMEHKTTRHKLWKEPELYMPKEQIEKAKKIFGME
jgi:hypothetical protein